MLWRNSAEKGDKECKEVGCKGNEVGREGGRRRLRDIMISTYNVGWGIGKAV